MKTKTKKKAKKEKEHVFIIPTTKITTDYGIMEVIEKNNRLLGFVNDNIAAQVCILKSIDRQLGRFTDVARLEGQVRALSGSIATMLQRLPEEPYTEDE
jgi:hypothetical protein